MANTTRCLTPAKAQTSIQSSRVLVSHARGISPAHWGEIVPSSKQPFDDPSFTERLNLGHLAFNGIFQARHIAALATTSAAFALLLSTAACAELSPTAPSPLPATRAPCAAFTPEADYIEQTLIMDLEGREIALRIPRVFLEDVWDQRPGFKDTAQLFRVEIGSFTPVSRPETGRRNKRRIWNWMDFLITDWVPLDRIAVLSAESRSSVIGGNSARDLDSYAPAPGPFGLAEIRSDAPQPTPSFRTNTYVFRSEDDTLSAVLSCNVPGSVMHPICLHWFRAAGMDVQLTYRRTELPNWRALQDDVTAFAGCLTNTNP